MATQEAERDQKSTEMDQRVTIDSDPGNPGNITARSFPCRKGDKCVIMLDESLLDGLLKSDQETNGHQVAEEWFEAYTAAGATRMERDGVTTPKLDWNALVHKRTIPKTIEAESGGKRLR